MRRAVEVVVETAVLIIAFMAVAYGVMNLYAAMMNPAGIPGVYYSLMGFGFLVVGVAVLRVIVRK